MQSHLLVGGQNFTKAAGPVYRAGIIVCWRVEVRVDLNLAILMKTRTLTWDLGSKNGTPSARNSLATSAGRRRGWALA
jgi:hypothetical protein